MCGSGDVGSSETVEGEADMVGMGSVMVALDAAGWDEFMVWPGRIKG